jgi:cytoskeletal protein CcmA (bactofilin family)
MLALTIDFPSRQQESIPMNRPIDMRPEASGPNASFGSGPRSPLRATPPSPARRVVDMTPPAVRRPPADGPRTQGEGRRMVVARDITLAGQISKCDFLIVEGAVEGMRYDGQALEVSDGGSFNGSIEVDSADIAGTFDGVVVVRGRLTVRPTGRITGTVRYGEIEINAGGQVNGEMQGMQTTPATRIAAPVIDVDSDDDSDDDKDSSSASSSSSESSND